MNGIEETVSGVLTVYRLETPKKVFRTRLWEQPDKHLFSKSEYYKLFPHDLYEDELNPYNWKRSAKVLSKQFRTKTDNQLLWNEFRNMVPGVYLAEGTCKDKNGQEVKSVSYFTVYDPLSTELPYPMAHWSHSFTSSAEPGEKAAFLLASSYSEVYCLFDQADAQGSKTSFIVPSLKPVEIEVKEEQRGGILLSTQFVKQGRIYTGTHYIKVPFSNKEIGISYSTFRNKLLPGQAEEWTLTLKNKKGEKVAAEMLAAMYDASLDAFVPNTWNLSLYQAFYQGSRWVHSLQDLSHSILWNDLQIKYLNPEVYSYDQLNYFGLGFYGGFDSYQVEVSGTQLKNKRTASKQEREVYKLSSGAPAPAESASMADADAKSGAALTREESQELASGNPKKESATLPALQTRKNFNETAFFFPDLQTNENGDVLLKFTVPESLTRWKLMGLAHTRDMSFGITQNECVTQKDLMVVPNLPRFFREGDDMQIRVKVNNLSKDELFAQAELHFYDAVSDQEVTGEWMGSQELLKENWVKKGESISLVWKIRVPDNQQAVKVKCVAKAGNYSDGEETAVPVLTNRMLVTESLPLPIRGKQSKDFSFTKFISQNDHSSTLKNHAFTVEFTANPAWYAVQSLPYLMEYPYECAEQTFSRYYSNALAKHIVDSKPQIKKVFDAWKISSPDAFLSNLEKNQELKALLLQETPWLLNAKEESENKKRIALLFDLNRMSHELKTALSKLEQMQSSSGGWPWFKGSPDDWYISQHILTGLGKLKKLGVHSGMEDARIQNMCHRALAFCDESLREHFEKLKRYNPKYKMENHLDHIAVQYLYMRSFYTELEVPLRTRDAFAFYKNQAEKYWLSGGRFVQGMIAVSLYRYKDQKTPASIIRSLKENSLNSEEMGMYWKENYGYYWYQAPVEMHALMIEAFDEITGDTKLVDDLKTWLIKSKQTQHWGTTKATTEAVYALLLKGTDWLLTEPDVVIHVGDIKLDPKNDNSLNAEAGSGYFKKTFSGTEIKAEMGQVKVSKSSEGVSWGAVYWQYFEQLDKITPYETPLKLSKKLFLQKNSASGPVITPLNENTALRVGDKLTVRIELRVDRDMEYVHLKDMRAAGLEALNVISTYKYQDGLGYYESTGDAATNFFISYLPKGTYVFEYPLILSHAGNFSNGISSIQCMYAPEYTSHSEGIRIQVKN